MMTSFSRQMGRSFKFLKRIEEEEEKLVFSCVSRPPVGGWEKKNIFQEKTRWDDEIFFCFFSFGGDFLSVCQLPASLTTRHGSFRPPPFIKKKKEEHFFLLL
jgi:hypothetical protein